MVSDLETQQKLLLSRTYDLRITNLSRFLYKNVIKKPGKLLDVGAGNGLVLKFFKEKGFTVSGIELENQLVQHMKKDPQLKDVPVSQGDITKKTGSSQYDYVLASDVIEHIKDDYGAIQNLFSYVAPGGLLVITVPAYAMLFGLRDKQWGHYRRYDAGNLLIKVKKLPGEVEYAGHWNIIGVFVYFLFEKILRRTPSENLRYKQSAPAKFLRFLLETELRVESLAGHIPFGLTLIVSVRKTV